MKELTRKSFVQRSAVAAAAATGAGFVGVLRAAPAEADYTGTVDGLVDDEGGELVNIMNPAWTNGGAKGDTVIVSGAGSISSGSATFTWTGGSFVTGDAGKVITVQGAGVSGAVLSTTISSVTNATTVVLNTSASTTVSGAGFAYGTDDTVAIVSAISAAGSTGRLFAPQRIYMIRGASNSNAPISLAGAGGLLGAGGSCEPGTTTPATVFLCGDATAGLLLDGSAEYQGFCCNGNGIATAPIQSGTVSGGVATSPGSFAVFVDVWATASAGNGWTIYGAQFSTFYSCGSSDNADDGIYIDGGASGLEFWHFQELGSGRYGIHGDDVYELGTTYGTSGVRFYSGSTWSPAGGSTGVSKIYLRGATDWNVVGMDVLGDNLTGPTVDLNQAAGGGLDFNGCWITATTGKTPALACISVGGSPPVGAAAITFVKTDRVNFVSGDISVYIAGTGNYRYSAIGWTGDSTPGGPVAAAGCPGIDTLLSGRTGAWQTPTPSSPWSGTPSYRVDADGLVRLSGSVTSSGGSGTIFTLGSGYASGASMLIPAALSTGSAVTVTIDSSGNVSAGDPGTGNSLGLDGIAFPVT